LVCALCTRGAHGAAGIIRLLELHDVLSASPNNIISDHIDLELQAWVNRAIKTLHLATNNEMTTQSNDKCNKDCNNTNSKCRI